MFNYTYWGPADWLAFGLILTVCVRLLILAGLHILGWCGIVLSHVFTLGKGRPSKGASPAEQEGRG